MAKFLFKVLAAEGAKWLAISGTAKAAVQKASKFGGTLDSFYYTFGAAASSAFATCRRRQWTRFSWR